MLKFTAGAVVGWVSARVLPSPKHSTDRLKPPTLEEIQILVQKAKDTTNKIIEKLDKN